MAKELERFGLDVEVVFMGGHEEIPENVGSVPAEDQCDVGTVEYVREI